MLILVADQILPVLVPHARQRPEERTCPYFIELHQVVIHQTLVDIFDGLEHDPFLSTDLLNFFKVKNFFPLVVDFQNFLPLFFKTQSFFPHLKI